MRLGLPGNERHASGGHLNNRRAGRTGSAWPGARSEPPHWVVTRVVAPCRRGRSRQARWGEALLPPVGSRQGDAGGAAAAFCSVSLLNSPESGRFGDLLIELCDQLAQVVDVFRDIRRGLPYLLELGLTLRERLLLGLEEAREPRAGLVEARRLSLELVAFGADVGHHADQLVELGGELKGLGAHFGKVVAMSMALLTIASASSRRVMMTGGGLRPMRCKAASSLCDLAVPLRQRAAQHLLLLIQLRKPAFDGRQLGLAALDEGRRLDQARVDVFALGGDTGKVLLQLTAALLDVFELSPARLELLAGFVNGWGSVLGEKEAARECRWPRPKRQRPP